MSKIQKEVNVLLSQIKAGDITKMEELYNLTYNHLKPVVMHYLFSSANCEDAISETYYRVIKYVKNFDETKDGYNWICRIAQNAANNTNREESTYVAFEEIQEEVNVPDEIDRMLLKNTFIQYLKKLPVTDRAIIYYRYYKDMTYQEIADKLNRAKSFVHNRLQILSRLIYQKYKKENK